MASTTEQREGAVEREMSTHQRGLVDTCLEEGQFESAIALLDQLRSPNYRPTTSHIRQLIYIALQPEHPPPINEMGFTEVPSSPSKAAFRKRIPSEAAVLAARRLLRSFAITNTPESIAAALPICDDPRNNNSSTHAEDDSSLESVIGPQSMCISRAKNCWSILVQGFTRRGQVLSMPSGKGKKRSHKVDEDEEDDPDVDNAVIGEDAWPTLDWLITIFEQDEMVAYSRGSGCFSNLLLRQIPCPRSGTGPRWDAETPLRVVFFCMEQTELRHQTLGARLMTLLIHLSETPYLDLSMFVASVYNRLTATDLEKLPALFSNMPPSTAAYKFKIALCQKLLTDSNHGQKRDGQPRVQARARALRTTRTEENLKLQSPGNLASSHLTKSPIPTCVEIQRCLETSMPSRSIAITQSVLLRVKFELVNSYGMLQHGMTFEEKDSDWLALLRTGRANQIVEAIFSSSLDHPEGRVFLDVLQSIMLVWKDSI